MALKTSGKLLSVIVPAYKEEKVIVQGLKAMAKVLDSIRHDYEIIVVVDGMLDSTYDKLKKAKIPKVRVLAYEENQGKWYAIRLGMKYAKGDYVMFIDGGMEIDPEGMAMLLEHMDWYEADIIVGSKRHPASKVEYTPLRRFLSYGYYYLVKTLFGVKVTDTQAGIKVMRSDVMKRIWPRLLEKRFSGDLEVLVIAQRLGYKDIYEAPIKLNFSLAKLSSAATLASIWKMFVETLAIFYRTRVIRFYDDPHRRFQEPSKIHVVSPPRK